MKLARTVLVVTAVISAHGIALAADSPRAPPPPPPSVPDMTTSKTAILCADCDRPFATSGHADLLKGLATNPFVAELRKALYTQDTYHQFQSKAHFDNCDFESSAEYVTELYEEAGRHADDASKAKAAGDSAGMKKAAMKAFFSLGQALHGTQDFYAHSNYVELVAPGARRITDLPILAPWRPEGRARIRQLRGQGLISGYVFWGFPQECPSGTMKHSDLAKDSATTRSGAVLVANLQNLSHYRVAVFLAREASLLLMTDAFRRWPLLKQLNGEGVAVDIIVDRRGL
jgi:hypothetical protein